MGMPVGELLERTSSRELVEYSLLFALQAEEAELRDQGLTPEEIADVIANPDAGVADAEGGLLDTLLGEEQAAERRHRLLAAELEAEADDEDDG